MDTRNMFDLASEAGGGKYDKLEKDTRNIFDISEHADGAEWDKLEKERRRVENEEYFVDKHFDVIFLLSIVIPLAGFAILLVITKNLGLAFMSAFICIVIFFSVRLLVTIMFKADKQERLREIEDKQDKFFNH